jgi:hypothetical protein
MEGDNIGKGVVRFYVVVLSLMSSSVSGLFVVEKNSINVIAPDSLRGKRQSESAIGNFGVPYYGGTMIGKVVYPEKGKDGCKSFEEFGVSFNKSDSHSDPVFFLIDRGGEFFFPWTIKLHISYISGIISHIRNTNETRRHLGN